MELDKYTITSSDTIPNPGNRLKFQFTVRNSGSTGLAKNISSQIAPLDTFASLPILVTTKYGNISAGETVDGSIKQYIKFENNCPDNVYTRFKFSIYSNDYLFWSDTLVHFLGV